MEHATPPASAGAGGSAGAWLDALFPFHLLLDPSLRVLHFGRAVPKVCRNVGSGSHMRDLFILSQPLLRPDQLTAEILLRAAASSCVLESTTTPMRLRGQLVAIGDQLLLVGTPWLRSLSELDKSQLGAGDFPAYDGTLELLCLLEAREAAVRFGERTPLEIPPPASPPPMEVRSRVQPSLPPAPAPPAAPPPPEPVVAAPAPVVAAPAPVVAAAAPVRPALTPQNSLPPPQLSRPLPAPATPDTDEPLDRETLLRLRRFQKKGAPDVVAELLGKFQRALREDLETLDRAVEARDLEALKDVAHKIKSSGAYLGAKRLSGLCAQIEDQGRLGSLDGALSLVTPFLAEVGRVHERIEAILGGAAI